MSLLTWNDSYSVKVRQFDDQHKKLVKMLNDLHLAMKAGKGKEVLEKILEGLIQYTSTHFIDEERLMKQYSYPGYALHKKDHNLLVIQVLDLQKDYQDGKPMLTLSVLTFLKDWLQNHIQGEDKKYGPFLNRKGIE